MSSCVNFCTPQFFSKQTSLFMRDASKSVVFDCIASWNIFTIRYLFFVINSSCWITGKLYIVLPCVDDSHTRHSRHHTLPYYITFLFVSFSTYWVRSCHSEMYHVGKRLHPFFGRQFSINLCVCLLYPPKCADIFQMSSAPNCLNDISFSSHENITRRQLHFFCKSH